MRLVGLAFVVAAAACAREPASEEVFTLYRDSPYLEATEDAALDPKWRRVHIATFDAADMDNKYNQSNCERTKDLFENAWRASREERPEHWANFWCERGRFRP